MTTDRPPVRRDDARRDHRPTHPKAKATLLMVGVLVLIVALALMSTVR